MRNQDFCYWLQGYFEISDEPFLNKERLLVINSMLSHITEPLGMYTQWLQHVIQYLTAQDFNKQLILFFTPEIQNRLNEIFYHVIDTSYDTEHSREESKRIHDGVAA